MSLRRLVLVAALLAHSLPVHGERFNVTANGERAADAQVCWFRAGDLASPITRFFAATSTQCAPANSEIRLSDGNWNVFARRGDDLISDDVLLLPGSSRDLKLVEAKPIAVPALREGEMLFAYMPAKGIAIAANIAPKGSTAIPLVVKAARIVAIGTDRPRLGRVDVVAAVAVRKTDRKELPEIEVGGSRAMSPLKRSGETTILFFRDVPATSSLTLRGKRWKSVDLPLPKSDSRVVTLNVEAVPTSKLVAHWWTPQPFESLAQKIEDCNARPGNDLWALHRDNFKPFSAALVRCPGQQPNSNEYMVDRDTCSVVSETRLDDKKLGGTAEFNDVPLGLYFVRYSQPGLPSVWRNVEVADRQLTEVDHEIRYYTLFGRVTRSSAPIRAQVMGTVSDANTGEYFAVLPREPSNIEFVAPCDGSPVYKAVLDHPPAAGSRLDFDIPNATVIVRVIDAKTKEPVPNAQSRLMILKEDKSPAISMRGDRTDLTGKVSIAPAPTDKNLRACADHPDYDRVCSDEFKMAGAAEKEIELAAVKHFRKAGRVIVPGAIGDGSLEWYTADGRQSEMAKVESDGSFVFTKPHAAGELVAFTSNTHPLHLFRQVFATSDDVLEFRLPNAPVRIIRVAMPKESTSGGGSITVMVGDLLYPAASVGFHIQKHQTQSSLMPGWSLQLDVLQTGPVSVIFVPLEMWPRAVKAGEMKQDPAFFPDARALPRFPVPDDGVVTIRSGASTASVE